jgi:GAF domain-containing protein
MYRLNISEGEEALKRRDTILEAVALAAHRFLTGISWEGQIQEVLEHLGESVQVSRVYIVENSLGPEGKPWLRQRYEWTSVGIDSQVDNPDSPSHHWEDGGMERWVKKLSNNEVIVGPVRSFPEGEREILQSRGIRSILVVPIFAGGEWWGLMGLDACLIEREWLPAEIDVLKAAADILGAAIERVGFEREREHLREHLQRALGRILSGLLPICASCKRIRDEEGAWHQLEEYLHHHSEVRFTHGLCPECTRTLYPELY